MQVNILGISHYSLDKICIIRHLISNERIVPTYLPICNHRTFTYLNDKKKIGITFTILQNTNFVILMFQININ